MTITPKALYDEVIRVAQKNPDKIGPRRYVKADLKPGCLLGTAMINLGVPAQALIKDNYTTISDESLQKTVFGKTYTKSTYVQNLIDIQRKQDETIIEENFNIDDILSHNTRHTWGEAVQV